MTHEEFLERLREVSLNKKQFAELSKTSHRTVIGWSGKPIPAWVDSWLTYFKDAQKIYQAEKLFSKQ